MSPRPARIAIAGSRDLAQQIAGYLSQSAAFEVVGFLDDFRTRGEATPRGPILGTLSEAKALLAQGAFDALALGVGYNDMKARGRILGSLVGAVPLFTFIHETAWVDASARLGEGVLLFPGCRVDANVAIGSGSVLNVGAVICHDSQVSENCFLGPSVTIAGFTRIGRDCFLGVGTVVSDNVEVAASIQTGAGAVVTESLAEAGLYLGVPARRRTK